jgi:hypothetical protein
MAGTCSACNGDGIQTITTDVLCAQCAGNGIRPSAEPPPHTSSGITPEIASSRHPGKVPAKDMKTG